MASVHWIPPTSTRDGLEAIILDRTVLLCEFGFKTKDVGWDTIGEVAIGWVEVVVLVTAVGWLAMGETETTSVVVVATAIGWVDVGATEIGWVEVGATETGWVLIGATDTGWVEVGAIDIGWVLIGATDIGCVEVGATAIGCVVVGATAIGWVAGTGFVKLTLDWLQRCVVILNEAQGPHWRLSTIK